MTINTERDPETGAVYHYVSRNQIVRTLSITDSVNIDFDAEGQVVGVEVLGHAPARERDIAELPGD